MKTPMQILLEKIENGDFIHPKVIGEFIKYNLLEKEKEVAQQYAEFAIECDRKELPVLEFDGWINL